MPRPLKTYDPDKDQLKPAGFVEKYEPWQIEELLKCKEDPLYFFRNYVYVKTQAGHSVKLNPYHYQERLLKTVIENRKVIAMLPRQSGKTTIAAAIILYYSIFFKNQRIIVASKDLSGARLIIDRIWDMYLELPSFIKPGVLVNNKTTKAFDCGSSIKGIATTPAAARGETPSFLYLDEFAFASGNTGTDKEFWTAVSPTIATGGKVLITSTPSTDETVFAQIWLNATPSSYSDKWHDEVDPPKEETTEKKYYKTIFETDLAKEEYKKSLNMGGINFEKTDDEVEEDGFVRFFAHWTSVPLGVDKDGKIIGYRDEKFKASEMKALTLDQWECEYECKFLGTSGGLLGASTIARMNQTVRPPVFVDRWSVRWYEPIRPNTIYAVAMDPAGDNTGDDCAIQVWSLPDLSQVAEFNSSIITQDEQVKMLWRILQRIYQTQDNHPDQEGDPVIYYGIERNGLGMGIIRAIEYIGEDKFPGIMVDATEISTGKNTRSTSLHSRGLVTTATNKKRYVLAFKDLLDRNLFEVRSSFLSSQLKSFVSRGRSWAANVGAKDDLVMSCVLAMILVDEIVYTYEPELADELPTNFYLSSLDVMEDG
ncbi:MAG: hypothetical protein D6698_02355 [Gammaproteobacteria bacterium]|nr:MAG: hypothetical protein D6698_02355 [Gammaproteobacteria bacterium]